jgi:hypothetical protein
VVAAGSAFVIIGKSAYSRVRGRSYSIAGRNGLWF